MRRERSGCGLLYGTRQEMARLLSPCTSSKLAWIMKSRSKTLTRTGSSVRRSVTIPVDLAIEVERVARKKHLTMSRALVMLAQRGVEAEAAARDNLNATYRRFMSEDDSRCKGEAGKDLIRAIFGKEAIAEDSIL